MVDPIASLRQQAGNPTERGARTFGAGACISLTRPSIAAKTQALALVQPIGYDITDQFNSDETPVMSSVPDLEMLSAFADSADQLLGSVDQRQRRRVLRDSNCALERAVWSQYAALGWLSALIHESAGGLGLGISHAAAIAKQVGRHLAPEPYAAACVRPALLLNAIPSSALRDSIIEKFLSGDMLIGVATQETAGSIAPERSRTVAARTTDGISISGSKVFVEPGKAADGWLVLASRDAAAALIWVPAGTPGLTLREERRVDGGLWATLELDRVLLGPGNELARGEAALEALALCDDGTRLMQAAELVGLAARARELTLDYMRVRKQFGKPIGSFQALQHRMVDAHLQVELAVAALDESMQRDWSELSCEARASNASRTKARAADAAIQMCRLCIQIHGAMGYTDECDIGLYFKRAIALNASLGTALAHRRRFFELSRRIALAQPEEVNGSMVYPRDTEWNSLSEQEFRSAVRRFLKDNYPESLRNLPRDAHWHQVKDWHGLLARQGWAAPAWPKEHGGMGLAPAKLVSFFEEMSGYGVARFISNGIQMLGPLLMKFGTPEQQAKYLPAILTNEHRWAQGYSEPNAGSDLASLNMQAVVDGDELVLNGRKIWTSHALECTHIFALVRTAKTEKPQDGISFVLMELGTPGIAVRGIKNIGLDVTFAEITFDDVRIPVSSVVGGLNRGWALAKALLGHERLFSGEPSPVLRTLQQIRGLAAARRLFDDQGFAERFVQVDLDTLDLVSLYNRFASIVKAGGQLGQDVSLLKICATETRQRACALLCDAANESGANIDPQVIGDFHLNLAMPQLIAFASSIAAGSNEIQRNIVSRHVLELP
jgi:3-oxochol-4-en-24-oyl-CoA dehydrogenase